MAIFRADDGSESFTGGTGPGLLLLHGIAGTWRNWAPVLPRLAHDFEVFAPNLPGHWKGPPLDGPPSLSTLADGIEQMLDALAWHDPHVAGNSLGGWLALELARRGRARSLSLFSPAGGYRPDDDELIRTAAFFAASRRLNQAMDRPGLDRFARRPRARRVLLGAAVVRADRVAPEDAAENVRAAARCEIHDRLLRSLLDSVPDDDLAGIDLPTTVVWGARDVVLPAERHQPHFERELPAARFVTLDDAGHVPMPDRPVAVAEIIASTALP